MIVNKTYFTGRLNIPNVNQNTVNNDLISNNDRLDMVIRESAIKYLSDVFGFLISKTILEQLENDGTVKATAEQKYKDLIDGNGSDWLGLRFEVNGIKYSQIANYVYCNYLQQNEQKLTNIGVTQDNSEKSSVVSSWNKYSDSWREMMAMRQPTWIGNWYNNLHPLYWHEKDTKTLYEYIVNNDDWNDRYFKTYENTNALGI